MRTIVEDDKVLFCGADVAKALGYAKPQNAIAQYCKNSTLIKDAPNQGTLYKGGIQTMLYIPEGDVYRLIVSSKLPGACPFTFLGEKALRKCYTCHISTYRSKILCIQGRRICV